jgi:hypothetical protein
MSNNVVEAKPNGTQNDDPNANQTSDAKDQSSSTGVKELPKAFGGSIDVKIVASLAGAFAFVCGWFYNLGFFTALNYDFMDLLTINDHVLSTLSSLPLALFMMALFVAVGIFLDKPFALAGDAFFRFGIKSNWKPRTIVAVFMFMMILVSAAPGLIMNGLRGYWEAVMFQVFGLVGGIIVLGTLFKLPIVPIQYAVNLTVSITILFAIGANGAGEARTYLKGGLLDTKVSSTTQEAENAYLVRSLSAGAIVIYPQLNKLAFIPKERIQYYSSIVQVNRYFDWKYIVPSFR